jgi:hypothetical protein
MKEKLVQVYLDTMMERAISLFNEDGVVITTSWATGTERAIFAQPIDMEGCDISRETRVGLHALMAIAVDATLIGRVDETYTQERDADSPIPETGELAMLADFDPSIQTALCVEAFDIDTGTSYLKIARLSLTENGEQDWNMDTYKNVSGQLVHENIVSALLVGYADEKITLEELEELATDLHWEIAHAPLITRG